MASMNSIIILDDDDDEVPSSSTSHTPPPRDPTNYTPQQSHTPPFPTNHTTKPTPDPPTYSNHKPDPSTTPSSSTNRSSGLLVNTALFDEIRYLESLLKVYSDEIQKLQEKELGLEDLEDEDSGYIQEHRLKRKMMKIYEKLCELKGCSSQTGRVIEQRIQYSGTRYPEINKRVERFINNPQSDAFPDYTDILRVMTRANEKHQLGLGRKQLQSLAQDAFRDVGNRLQERRHLDLVYNFGSHLTDQYSSRADPALSDPVLSKKLHSNRALALSSIDQVITKYAALQDEMDEQERKRRIEREKEKKEKEGDVDGEEEGEWTSRAQDETPSMSKEERGEGDEEEEEEEEEEVEEEEEEEDDDEEEEDISSDPDIEEELERSRAAEGEEADEEKDQGIDQDRLMAKEGGISCSEEEGDDNGEEVGEDSQSEKSRDEDRTSETHKTTSDTQTPIGKAAATGSPSPPASPSQSGTQEVKQEVGDSPRDDIMEVEQKTANRNSPLSLCSVNESPPLSSSGSAIRSTGLSPKASEKSLCGSLLSCHGDSRSSLSSRADSPLLPGVLISSNLDNAPRSPSPPLSANLGSPLLVCSQASNHSSSGEGHTDTTANHGSSRSVKRKRGSSSPSRKQGMNGRSRDTKKAPLDSVDEEISLDMGVCSSSPPDSHCTVFPVADSTRADSPLSQLVSSSQPSSSKCNPSKRKKVTVATQCDPEEVIVLSDSD
ncbi:UNVERIFIED_CONTAM: hypothetical protein FKN15_069970 [Acipenser sinensis]